MSLTLSSLLPLCFLLIGVIDDLLFKKFHNWLFLTLSFVAIVYVFGFSNIEPLNALGGAAVGGLLLLPMVLIGAMGAGDMKFMICFGIIMGTKPTVEILLYSIFWGALIGVLQIVFAGNLKLFLNNLMGFAYKLKPAQTNKIPYTIAILFGWVSYISFGGLIW